MSFTTASMKNLDAALSGLVSLVVLKQGNPGGFGTNVVDARSFRGDCRVVTGRMGGWAYKGSAVVMEIAIHTGNKAPQVVDAIDKVTGCLEKDWQDGVVEMDEIVVGGLSIDGEEKHLGCCEG